MEGMAMHTRYLLIASAALAMASTAAAEPAKPQPQPAAQPANRPAEVMMASADRLPTAVPAAAQEQPTVPAKRPRAARVTTCRCAGQNQP